MRSVITMSMVTPMLVTITGCERSALDRQMHELCKKDGGVKVYETVVLRSSEFSSTGQPLAKYTNSAKSDSDYLGPDYRYVQSREVIVGKGADMERGEGQLSRWYSAVYRRSDDRLLGESVSYGRGGGDGFTFGFQPSGNHCPNPRIDLIKSVFIKEG
jgi:hypothetical protein